MTEINDLLQNAENTIAPQEQPINTAAEPIEGPSRTIPLPSSSSTLPIPQSNDLSQSITLPKCIITTWMVSNTIENLNKKIVILIIKSIFLLIIKQI